MLLSIHTIIHKLLTLISDKYSLIFSIIVYIFYINTLYCSRIDSVFFNYHTSRNSLIYYIYKQVSFCSHPNYIFSKIVIQLSVDQPTSMPINEV